MSEMLDDTELELTEQEVTEENESLTESQATPSQVDNEELVTLRQVTQSMMQREQALADELKVLRARVNAPPPVEEAPLPDKNEDPIGYLEAVNERRMKALEARLESQAKPMQELVLSSRHQQEYATEAQRLIQKYPKLDAGFFTKLYNQVGGVNFNVQQLELAALAAYGAQSITGVPDPTPNSSTSNDPPVRTTPPRTPSSLPTNTPKTSMKLTEGERRAMETMKLKPTDPKDVEKFRSYMNSDTRLIDMGY